MEQYQKIYRNYSYVIFGAEKVGKTNIITRCTKDEFSEAHNLTLEGKQSTALIIDGRVFQISLYDTAGQEGMTTMKAVWRNNKDGFIFTFAINNRRSFEFILSEIKDIKEQQCYKNVAMILVGNKQDLDEEREVEKSEAKALADRYQIRYCEASAKSSYRRNIEKIIVELIEMNEMARYTEDDSATGRSPFSRIWHPCRDSSCQVM